MFISPRMFSNENAEDAFLVENISCYSLGFLNTALRTIARSACVLLVKEVDLNLTFVSFYYFRLKTFDEKS